MDTDDTSDANLEGQAPDADRESAPPTGRPSIIGGLARQWWRILLTWLVVTTPLVYAIYLVVEPMYEATSLLRAELNLLEGCDQLHASILNQEMGYLKRLQESVKLKLAQLEFEIGQEAYRISVHDKAAVPKVPVNNSRLKLMAITPVGILFIVIGLFLLQEIVSSRASASGTTTEPSPRE